MRRHFNGLRRLGRRDGARRDLLAVGGTELARDVAPRCAIVRGRFRGHHVTAGAGILQPLGRPPRLGVGVRLRGLGARGTQVVVRVGLGRARSSYTEARLDGVERLSDGPVDLKRCRDSTAATLRLVAPGRQDLPAPTQHTYTPPPIEPRAS